MTKSIHWSRSSQALSGPLCRQTAEHAREEWVNVPRGTSLVAQKVKHLPTVQETRVRSLGQEDPLEKAMASHFSTLAWKVPWMEEPVGVQSMGSQRVRGDWASLLHFFFYARRTHNCNMINAEDSYRGLGLFIWASLVAQWVKSPPAMKEMQETQVRSLGWEDHLQKGTANHSNILARKIPWIEEPGRLESTTLQRVEQHWIYWACTHAGVFIYSSCYILMLIMTFSSYPNWKECLLRNTNVYLFFFLISRWS